MLTAMPGAVGRLKRKAISASRRVKSAWRISPRKSMSMPGKARSAGVRRGASTWVANAGGAEMLTTPARVVASKMEMSMGSML